MAEKTKRGLAFAQQDRDDALRRVSRVRGMVVLGAGALTAGLAGVASAAAPGHTRGATTKTTFAAVSRYVAARPGTGSSALRMPPLARPSQLGLQAPGSAPQSAAPQPAAPSSQAQPQAAPAPAAPQPVAPASGGAVSGGS